MKAPEELLLENASDQSCKKALFLLHLVQQSQNQNLLCISNTPLQEKVEQFDWKTVERLFDHPGVKYFV